MNRRYGIPQVSNLSYDSVIFYYSHRALTETEKMVLARGLRFCLPPKSVDSISVKCSFEMLYRDLIGLGHSLTSEDQDRLQVNLVPRVSHLTAPQSERGETLSPRSLHGAVR